MLQKRENNMLYEEYNSELDLVEANIVNILNENKLNDTIINKILFELNRLK
jgi:hypothetical protein